MLTCIACTKQVEESGGEDGARGTPTAKDAVKSLTSQIKDIALKFSGVYKQSKPSAGSSSSKGPRTCPDFETIAQGLHYPYVQGGSSTNRFGPTSHFPPINRHHQPPPASQSGLPGSGGGCDDRVPESISDVVLLDGDDDEPKEWVAQVEPGVQITFLSLPQGGNDLKRIRFSREMFNKWEAQRWWGENYDRVMELYNVQRFNRQALPTPLRSEDERDSSYSRIGSSRESPVTPPLSKEQLQRNCYNRPVTGKGHFPSDSSEYSQHNSTVPSIYGVVTKGERSSVDASRTTTSSRDEASISISNASDLETEWVEQDEPGVYITIRALPDGTRELRRVRFSRERFGEMHAKLWWEQNRERIQAQYL